MSNIVTFFVCRGHKLEDMLNATYSEKVFYYVAKEKYIKEEMEKYQAILGVDEK